MMIISPNKALSMLSTIQTVKLGARQQQQQQRDDERSQEGGGGEGAASSEASGSSSAASEVKETVPQKQNSLGDMSRRKQRNPKPLFSEVEMELPAAATTDQLASGEKMLQERQDDTDGPNKEGGSIQTETSPTEQEQEKKRETNRVSTSPTSFSVSIDDSSSSEESGLTRSVKTDHDGMTRSSAAPTKLIQKQRPTPNTLLPPQIPQALEDMLTKNNMFHFGDVTLSDNQPECIQPPPVPMVLPMAYLLPVSLPEVGVKYRMFVPINGGPSVDPAAMTMMMSKMTGSSSQQPQSSQGIGHKTVFRKRTTSATSSEDSAVSSNLALTKKDSRPLDLSKSSEEDEMEEEEVDSDARALEQLEKRAPGKRRTSVCSEVQTQSQELRQQQLSLRQQQHEFEAHISFLKVKQMELMNKQITKEQAESRCEECNINFSKHQNYVAHKKYYCSGQTGASNSSTIRPKKDSPLIKSESGASVIPSSSLVAVMRSPVASPVLGGQDLLMAHVETTSTKSKNNGNVKNEKTSGLSKTCDLAPAHPPPPPLALRLPTLPPVTAATAIGNLLGTMVSTTEAANMALIKQQQELLRKTGTAFKVLTGAGHPLPTDSPPLAAVSPTAPADTSPTSASTSSAPVPTAVGHFVCEGCGIKFKSGTNLQAHQARYCAGLRKQEEIKALESLLKRSQQHSPSPAVNTLTGAASQRQQLHLPFSAAEMMSLLNAKSLEQQAKDVAGAGASAEPTDSPKSPPAPIGEDFCCILCGYKESSVERLKDHINMHFIGQIKRQQQHAGAPGSHRRLPLSPGRKTPTSDKGEVCPLPPKRAKPDEEDCHGGREEESQTSPTKDSIRCEFCDIGFAHLTNFVAHKKYYCRGQTTQDGSKEGKSSSTVVATIDTNKS